MWRAILLPLLLSALALGAAACGSDSARDASPDPGSSAPSDAAGAPSPTVTPSPSGQVPAARGTPAQADPTADSLTTVYFVHADW